MPTPVSTSPPASTPAPSSGRQTRKTVTTSTVTVPKPVKKTPTRSDGKKKEDSVVDHASPSSDVKIVGSRREYISRDFARYPWLIV